MVMIGTLWDQMEAFMDNTEPFLGRIWPFWDQKLAFIARIRPDSGADVVFIDKIGSFWSRWEYLWTDYTIIKPFWNQMGV